MTAGLRARGHERADGPEATVAVIAPGRLGIGERSGEGSTLIFR
jgi:hypothetical protein